MHHEHTEYRLVVGHPAYRVGSDGTVWTRWKRVGNGRGNGKGAKCILGSEWRPLKTGTVRGYTKFNMSVHNTTRSMLLHVAILEAFVEKRPHGMQCAHYNGDRNDNRLENLRWATPQENEADKRRHGKSNSGERHYLAKLTNKSVRIIRARLGRGDKQCVIASDFRVSASTISEIKTGRKWKATT